MWQEKNGELYRDLKFKNFDEAFSFMQKVAKLAKQQNHHPKWLNKWNRVEIWLSTHEGGNQITDKDRKLAKAIDSVYKEKSQEEPGSNIRVAKLYTDGGARGNPGPAAGAYVICKMDGNVVEKSGMYLGKKTNNQAEYHALKVGLDRALEQGIQKLLVHMDSELVVKQMNGLYKVKNQLLIPLHQQVRQLSDKFQQIEYLYIPRQLNKLADQEMNRILDETKKPNSG